MTDDDDLIAHKEGDRTRYLAPALTRGLDVLETLSPYPDGLTPAELSVQLDLTTSQLFRILTTLELRGYINRSLAGDRYKLTLRMFTIATRHPPVERLLTEAGRVIRHLVRNIGQAALLSTRDGSQMTILSVVPAPAPVSLLVPVGQVFPLLTSTAGLYHFSQEPTVVRERLLEEIGPSGRQAAGERIAPERLSALIGASSLVEPSPDIVGVTNHTCVIRDHTGDPIASLTVPFVTRTNAPVSEDVAHEEMLAASTQLSRQLGSTLPPRPGSTKVQFHR